MNWVAVTLIIVPLAIRAHAGEPCKMIHGRAHLYGGDGQLRIWEIGSHHEYEPDSSTRDTVLKWLDAGVNDLERLKYASPASVVSLYADFLVCPAEPFRQGSVQLAKIKSASHRRYRHTE